MCRRLVRPVAARVRPKTRRKPTARIKAMARLAAALLIALPTATVGKQPDDDGWLWEQTASVAMGKVRCLLSAPPVVTAARLTPGLSGPR